MINVRLVATTMIALLAAGAGIGAQPAGKLAVVGPPTVDFLGAKMLEPLRPVRNAPFTADTVTEFTQMLPDGNRIERTFRGMLARDSQGRTRQEQEIALIGPLAALDGTLPRMITIHDPVEGVQYTLDERTKTAFKGIAARVAARPGPSATISGRPGTAGPQPGPGASVTFNAVKPPSVAGAAAAAMPAQLIGTLPVGVHDAEAATTPLGPAVIEGFPVEGTRTTITIPAGAVGNVAPIAIVTDRWFSTELQMAVQINRRDPRSGETVYRLTNIVRGEPSPELFAVPGGYRVQDLREVLLKKVRQ